ncbi:MAG: hypothetical protein IK954_02265 [Clostridia bacterium]|nr:hypothetical protein [Clostridia bacterium]
MSFRNQIIVILLCFLLSFLYVRGFFYGIKRYQLNNSSYKKRKNGENFKEWLFYSRYKEEIPKILRVLYYTILIIHPVCLIFCLFAQIITLPLNLAGALAIFIAGFDVIWILVLALLFWSPGPGYAYERWITKKRGQNKKKK